jgi:hypothetical protein
MNYKSIITIILLGLALSGCSTTTFKPIESGPRAKLNFTSPEIHDEPALYYKNVDLLIYDHPSECVFDHQGQLAIKDDDLSETTYIKADTMAYLRVKIFGDGPYRGLNGGFQIAFMPEKDNEYTVEYVEMPNKFKLHLYHNISETERTKLPYKQWWACPKS